jgi:hypothetical protein
VRLVRVSIIAAAAGLIAPMVLAYLIGTKSVRRLIGRRFDQAKRIFESELANWVE